MLERVKLRQNAIAEAITGYTPERLAAVGAKGNGVAAMEVDGDGQSDDDAKNSIKKKKGKLLNVCQITRGL